MGDCDNTLGGAEKQSFNRNVQNLFTVTTLPVCRSCVKTHTHAHTRFLHPSYQITCSSVFHGQVVRCYSVPCREGLTSLLRSPDRNHKALQRGSDANRTTAVCSKLLLYTPHHCGGVESSLQLTMVLLIKEISFKITQIIFRAAMISRLIDL